MKSYHFDCGDSTHGPIGFCARVRAETPERALELLRAALPPSMPVDGDGDGEGIEYIEVYFSGDGISVDDIDDEEEDEDEDDEDDEEEEDDEDEDDDEEADQPAEPVVARAPVVRQRRRAAARPAGPPVGGVDD